MDGKTDTRSEYIRAATVCETLVEVSPKTLYRWAKDPTMPVLKIGGAVMFHRTRLIKWLSDREQGQALVRPRAVNGGSR
jgi:hypothetical protein